MGFVPKPNSTLSTSSQKWKLNINRCKVLTYPTFIPVFGLINSTFDPLSSNFRIHRKNLSIWGPFPLTQFYMIESHFLYGSFDTHKSLWIQKHYYAHMGNVNVMPPAWSYCTPKPLWSENVSEKESPTWDKRCEAVKMWAFISSGFRTGSAYLRPNGSHEKKKDPRTLLRCGVIVSAHFDLASSHKRF